MVNWEPARILEVELAAALVEAWGYPRKVEPYELEAGDWFRLGSLVVWWYEPEDARLPGCRFLHLAVAPAARRRWPVRSWHELAQALAVMLGAARLVVADFEESGHVAAYLRRLGWTAEGPFMVRPLGGDVVGKAVSGLFSNMGESFKSPFTKNFWTDPKKVLQQVDPGHLFINGLGNKPQPKVPSDPNAVAADAAEREKERRRIATGSPTTYSGRRSDALAASIGKRLLGGAN